MPPIVFWSLLYWAIMLGIGILIAVKVTKFKWFLWWIVACIILYGVWMWLFPPPKTWNDEEIINTTTKYNFTSSDTVTWVNGGGDYDTIPLKAGYSLSNGDTVPGWGPDLFVDSAYTITFQGYIPPKPRKDTVDWKRWFKENTDPITFDTSGTDKLYSFQLLVMAVIRDTAGKHEFIEPLKIDGDGKMTVTDSLLAIQELIKNMLISSKHYRDQLRKYDTLVNEYNMIVNEALRKGQL